MDCLTGLSSAIYRKLLVMKRQLFAFSGLKADLVDKNYFRRALRMNFIVNESLFPLSAQAIGTYIMYVYNIIYIYITCYRSSQKFKKICKTFGKLKTLESKTNYEIAVHK